MTQATGIIDKSAHIGQDVILGNNVTIRENVIIEGRVTVGDNCIFEPFSIIRGPTTIGTNNHFYQFCSIGEACQDLKYDGEPTTLTIGDNNIIREHVSMHRGTIQGRGNTSVGSDNLFMINTHIAHDCVVGNNCIFSNNATLAGHVIIDDYVVFGGLAAIHQFGRVGCHAMVGGMAALNMDVPPYVMAAGHYAKPFGINKRGLQRRGFSDESISAIFQSYMILYKKHLTVDEAIPEIEKIAAEYPEVVPFVEFLKTHGRGIIR